MPNITLTVPAAIFAKMKEHPEFRWSEVARQAIENKVKDAELLDDLKAAAKGEKEYREGKTISHKQLLKELGL